MSDISLKLKEYSAVNPKVFAFKITSIVELGNGRSVLVAAGDLALVVNEAFTKKWLPQVNDYFVGSPSGAQTILSAEIFECPDFGWKPTNQA